MMDFLHSIDWQKWAYFVGVVAAVGGALWLITKKFVVTREECAFVEHGFTKQMERLTNITIRHDRDIMSLFRERKSFRQEVLDRVGTISERVENLSKDVSDLKDLIISRIT